MIVISVLIFLQAVLLVALYQFVYKKVSIFDPIIVFLAFFVLFVLPLPLHLCFTEEATGEISDQLANFAPYVPFAVLLCTVGLLFFLWAYFSPLNKFIAARIPVPGEPKTNSYFTPFFTFDRTRFTALAICLFSLFLLSKLAEGGILPFLLLGYDSTEIMFGRGYLAAGIPWFFVGTMLLLFRYSARKSRLDLFIFSALLLLQLAALFLLGDRHSVLNFILAAVIFWHFAVGNIKFTRLAAIAVIGFLVLNLVGFLRQSDYKNLGAFVDSTGDSAARFTEHGTDDVAFSLTSGEFAIPFETLPQIIRKFGGDSAPCKWGLTYLQAPLQIIPSVFWTNRPLPLANWYVRTFYGPGWQMNQGRQFFFLSEGYLNFGPIGVLLEMSFYGFLLGILGQYRKLNGANKGAIFLYAICLAFLPRTIYADSTGLIVGLPEQFLLMSIIGLWISGGFGRNTNHPGSRVTSPSPYVSLE